jgi:hypothetical protein
MALVVVGVFLILLGKTTEDAGLVDLGTSMIWWGVGLQVLYLLFKYGPALLEALDKLNR